METPPAEELLRKIQELEAGQAHLQHEMSKLRLSGGSDSRPEHRARQRSHSVSPERSAARRRAGFTARPGWKKGSATFTHSSPLQRESRSLEEPPNVGGTGGFIGRPAEMNFTERQYLNILQSMGQAVHIFDLEGRIIYW